MRFSSLSSLVPLVTHILSGLSSILLGSNAVALDGPIGSIGPTELAEKGGHSAAQEQRSESSALSWSAIEQEVRYNVSSLADDFQTPRAQVISNWPRSSPEQTATTSLHSMIHERSSNESGEASTIVATTLLSAGELIHQQGPVTVIEPTIFQAVQAHYLRHSPSVSMIMIIAYTIVFFVGIVGNSFVVAIVCKSPRMRTVTNYFIVNLALADILVLLFCLPATLIGNLFIPYLLGLFVCKTVSYLQGVAVSASINTLVAVTMDRFLAICFPMDWHMSRREVKWTIACIWIFSLSISLPWALYFKLLPTSIETSPGQLHNVYVCAEEWPSERIGTLYFVLANLILCYLLPAVLIILCYLGIWYKIERRNIPGVRPKGLKIELIMQKSRLKVVKMMMVVVVIFLLSWLPLYVMFARIKLVKVRSEWEEWLIGTLMPLAQWLGASNSCINPILYTFFNRKYKRGFVGCLRFGFCCERERLSESARPITVLHNGSNGNHNCVDRYVRRMNCSLQSNSTNANQIQMDTLKRQDHQQRRASSKRRQLLQNSAPSELNSTSTSTICELKAANKQQTDLSISDTSSFFATCASPSSRKWRPSSPGQTTTMGAQTTRYLTASSTSSTVLQTSSSDKDDQRLVLRFTGSDLEQSAEICSLGYKKDLSKRALQSPIGGTTKDSRQQPDEEEAPSFGGLITANSSHRGSTPSDSLSPVRPLPVGRGTSATTGTNQQVTGADQLVSV